MAIIEVGKRFIQARTNSLHEEIDLDELETEKPKPKLEVAAQMGFNKNQVAQFQKLANNPDAAETEKFIAEKAAEGKKIFKRNAPLFCCDDSLALLIYR